MKIIKTSSVTLYFLLILIFCGYIKTGLIILIIILFHELGHILVCQHYKYKILSITIYPFGGVIKLNKDLNTSTFKDIMLSIAGVINELILYLIIYILPLSPNTKLIFYKYNTSIMLFNVLPIIPLDGYYLVNAIYNKYFSFKFSLKLSIITSIIFISIYILFNYKYNLNNYLLVGLFIYKLIDYIKNYNYLVNRFLLERYIKKYKYKDISYKKGSLDILKIDTYQYFKENKKIIREEEKLKERFDKQDII